MLNEFNIGRYVMLVRKCHHVLDRFDATDKRFDNNFFAEDQSVWEKRQRVRGNADQAQRPTGLKQR